MILFISGLVAGAACGVLIMGAITAGRLSDMEERLDLLKDDQVTFVRSPADRPMNVDEWWNDYDRPTWTGEPRN